MSISMGGRFGSGGMQSAQMLERLGFPDDLSQKIGDMLDGPNQRNAFSALLVATAAAAQKKPNFNLELEINDLLVHLDALRRQGMASQLPGMLTQLNLMFFSGLMRTVRDLPPSTLPPGSMRRALNL